MLGFRRYARRKLQFSGTISMEIASMLRSKSTRLLDHLAIKLFNIFIANKSIEEGVTNFLDIAYTLDCLKVKVSGQNASTAFSNALVGKLALKTVKERDFSGTDIACITVFAKSIKKDETNGWFYPKIEILRQLAEMKFLSTKWIKKVFLPYAGHILNALHTDMRDLDKQVGNLMAELAIMRKYGVKTCYFQDGILHSANQAWVYVDFNELLTAQNFHAWGSSEELALVILSKRSTAADTKLLPDNRSGNGWKVIGTKTTGEAFFSWSINRLGELSIHSGYGCIPIRDIFRAHGKEMEYELIRLSHVMRLYDLVVPVTTVAKMPEPPSQKSRLLGNLIPSFLKPKLVTPELIVPRVREIENNLNQVIRDLKEEVERAEADTEKRTQKREIINHVRRLPAGHHPSAKARARALEEAGITLADNETYVKKHTRNIASNVVPGIHLAKRRR